MCHNFFHIYDYTKLETPAPVRTLKKKHTEVKQLGPRVSTWMGDHSSLGRGCCTVYSCY